MEMKIGLHLHQRQQLVMTPKLQQALKLLQMPAIELQQMLKQEMIENPLLEEADELEDYQEETQEETEDEDDLDSKADGDDSKLADQLIGKVALRHRHLLEELLLCLFG